MINQQQKDQQILNGIYAEWDRAERKYDERNLPEAIHKAKKRGAKFERKNITSCTHCGDTYSADDALKLNYKFNILACDDEEAAVRIQDAYSNCYDNEDYFMDFWAFDAKNKMLYTSDKVCKFLNTETECLKCHKQYLPITNYNPATMDKWIYDMHKGCKGG